MKGAVETFTKYLAKEVVPRGITANVVAPGLIETSFTQPTFEKAEDVERVKSITALERTGVPDDIGGMVAFFMLGGGPLDHRATLRSFGRHEPVAGRKAGNTRSKRQRRIYRRLIQP